MPGINVVLFFVALLGFLPLAIILFKKNRVKKILATGVCTTAIVYDVRRMSRAGSELVSYQFNVQSHTKTCTGKLMVPYGKYKIGDMLDVYYLPANPRRSTVTGAWGSPVIVVFGVVIALFILFAVYKMYEMYKTGGY